MQRIVASIVIMFSSFYALAQSEENLSKSISGLICDRDSLTPLPNATMTLDGHVFPVDAAGRATAIANVGDTLVFRHIGYREAQLIVGDSLYAQSMFAVFLSRDTVELSEVVVRPRLLRLAEMSQFMPVVRTPSDIIAEQNVRRSTYTALTQPNLNAMDANDNQRMTINRHAYELEYRHMIAPDQMVGIGVAAVALIYKLIAQTVDGDSNQRVRPLSGREVEILIRSYCPNYGNRALQKTD